MTSLTNSIVPTTEHGLHLHQLAVSRPPLAVAAQSSALSESNGNIIVGSIAPSSSSSTKATSPTATATATATSQLKKKSQRPSWSCTECTRRKIKCDRIVPGCSACRRRNAVDQCRLDESLLLDSVGTLAENKRRRSSTSHSSKRNALNKSDEHMQQQQSTRRSSVSSTATSPSPSSFSDVTPNHGLQAQLQPPTLSKIQDQNRSISASLPNAATMDYQALNNIVKGLRAQLSQLEQVVNLSTHKPEKSIFLNGSTQGSHLTTGANFDTAVAASQHERATASNESSGGGSPPEPDGELEAAETLEFLAMGRDRKAQHLSRAELRRPADEDEVDDAIVVDSTPSTSSGGALSWLGASSTSLVKSPIGALLPLVPHHPSGLSADGSNALLDERRSRLVVRWAMSHMLAHNGLLHPPTFLSECIEFENWPLSDRHRLVNAAWLGLYYAVLCGALQQMSRHDATQIGLSIDDYHRLPKAYFDACVQALHRADFLSKHSRFSVQAICIITTAGYEAGQSDLINTLLGCAIRIAQHLQFHRLGSSDTEWQARQARKGVVLTSDIGAKTAINREICKRLWCTLGADDWFTCTVRHSYAIHSTHTNTPLPLNISDEDLSVGALAKALPYDVPTPASKLILLHALADRVRTLFNVINVTDKPSQELTNQIDLGIDEVMNRAPAWLQTGWVAPSGMAVPGWVAELRQHWFISCEHKRLVLHRLCPTRGLFRDTAHPYVRQAAVKAARKVLHHFTATDKWPRNWTISYHAIVACTTLLLDLSHLSPPSSSASNSPCASTSTSTSTPLPLSNPYLAKRNEVLSALESLRLISDDSIIASRGIRLIEAMLIEEAKSNAPEGGSQSKRKFQDGEDVRIHEARGKKFAGSQRCSSRVDVELELGSTGSVRVPTAQGPTSLNPHGHIIACPSLGATLFDPSIPTHTTPLNLVDTFDLSIPSSNSLGALLQNLPDPTMTTTSTTSMFPGPQQDEMGFRLGSSSSPLGRDDFAVALESILLDGFAKDWSALDQHGGVVGVEKGGTGFEGGCGGGGGGGGGRGAFDEILSYFN
ncbi:BQ2448_2767 [Microbotryum intermedium]|uniref:BQ2448_2767 protein n=1 Tax=Microbotryum intermedium TaxID=269621 RepID=A0A238FEF2_9BASI|nr:BQ2448_2767 [Microbotryum intermedium]